MPELIDLEVSRVDLVDEGANSQAHIMLYKRKENNAMKYEDILKSLKPEHVATIEAEINKAKAIVPEETATALSNVQKSLKDTEAELKLAKEATVTKSKDAEPDFDEVIKGLDPAVQAVMKRMQSEKEAAEEIAKMAADKQLHDSAVTKAASLKSLPIEQDKLVEVVKGITPEVFEILKAANAAVEGSGVLEELGDSGKDSVEKAKDSTHAWEMLEKKAAELAVEKGIKASEAMTEVIKSNRELYKQSLGGAN